MRTKNKSFKYGDNYVKKLIHKYTMKEKAKSYLPNI